MIIVTHVGVVYQGTADECVIILAHLWTWDILHHNKTFMIMESKSPLRLESKSLDWLAI